MAKKKKKKILLKKWKNKFDFLNPASLCDIFLYLWYMTSVPCLRVHYIPRPPSSFQAGPALWFAYKNKETNNQNLIYCKRDTKINIFLYYIVFKNIR